MSTVLGRGSAFLPLVLALLLLLPSTGVTSFQGLKTNAVRSENSSLQARRDIARLESDGISQYLVSRASHIVVGEVKNIESKWDGAEGTIYSYVRISVESRLKGDFNSGEVVVKHKGGEVGGIGLLDSAEPRFWRGERVKLFLKQLERTNEFVVVGGKQGEISLSSPASSGYSYDGFHWAANDLPVGYLINENGTPDTLGTAGEFAAVQASFQTWEDDAGSYMDYTYLGTTTINGAFRDGSNVVSWKSIDGSGGTLAETSIWYDSQTKLLLESDIVFDEDETWSASGELGKYDVQDVGTHEVGHTLVLNDLYDVADSEETMYGYSSSGETRKRDLYTGDIAGIRSIYGLQVTTYTIDTNPTGLHMEVDGANYTTPYSFSWFSGSEHIVNAFSPQSTDAATRYVFEKWNDNGTQVHSITVGTNDAALTAVYTLQYRISIMFETYDSARQIYPTQIRIVGGPPNNTSTILSVYSDIWLDDVQWIIREILWQKNNVVPVNYPTARLSADLEWTIKSRVYPTRFNESFKDSSGLTLPNNPSSFRLEFPNGTTSNLLDPLNVYYLQNGTTSWHSITWQGAEVAPTNAIFDAADGNPTVNCLVFNIAIRVTDLFGLPVQGASVSITLPNGTTAIEYTRTDGLAVFATIPQGRFTAQVSYIGQTSTLIGNVGETALHPAKAQITFSLPILFLIFVPVVSACLVIVFLAVRRRRTIVSLTQPEA